MSKYICNSCKRECFLRMITSTGASNAVSSCCGSEYHEEIEEVSEGTQKKIEAMMNNFSEFLQEKNRRYGDSALNPEKVFSKHRPDSDVASRLDEKYSRIKNADELKKNDVCDLFGHLALLMIEEEWTDFDEFLD